MKPPNHMEQATQRLSINEFVKQSLQIRKMYYNGYTMYTLGVTKSVHARM